MYANLSKGWMELVRYTNCRTRMGEVKETERNEWQMCFKFNPRN